MKTKIRITGGGIFGANGEVPVGEEFTINGDVPAAWAGKVAVLGTVEDDAPVIAAADDVDRAAVIAALDAAGIEYDKRWRTDRLQSLLPSGE